MKTIARLIIAVLCAASWSLAFVFGFLFFLIQEPWLDISAIKGEVTQKPSVVLDDQGQEWARFQIDRRKQVPLTLLPKHVIQAFIASEDRDFFTHPGISLKGIARSLYINFIKRSKAQGASTITQQLVRLLFFDHKKTFKRKIQEQFLALAVEAHYTKELILEAYLNNLYFGRGIYGIEAASQRFWSIDAHQLTLDQAATLAAIIPSPGRYCPLINPEATKARRAVVLTTMCKQNFITPQELKTFSQEPLGIKNSHQTSSTGHIQETIRLFLEELVGKQALYTQGLTIQTTLNRNTQNTAQDSFEKQLEKLKDQLTDSLEGALICLDTETSAIKALVGGYDFKTSQFNRALHAQRQIGSVFKPIIYAAAIDTGIDFNEIVVDEPFSIGSWSPQNFNKKCEGPMTLAHALSVSKNTIAVTMLMRVGIPTVIAYAQAFGITAPLPAYPSLALGCIDSTPLEVAGMFNVFANQGIYQTPYLISWIKDAWGKKIWRHKTLSKQAISWNTASKVTQALSIAFNRRKRHSPEIWPLNVEVCGKTGTTNDCRTCWYIGSTPTYTTVVYIGRDDNKSLGQDIYPSMTALPLWLEFNKQLVHTRTEFKHHPALTPVFIHPITGILCSADSSCDAICIRAAKPDGPSS